jgi:hypothetical protein
MMVQRRGADHPDEFGVNAAVLMKVAPALLETLEGVTALEINVERCPSGCRHQSGIGLRLAQMFFAVRHGGHAGIPD